MMEGAAAVSYSQESMARALHIGDEAPDFEVSDQNRESHRLSDHRGEWVLLYFYPKDETPGCTAEACAFRDTYEDFRDKVVILGISADTVESHFAFAARHRLPFPLLADPDRRVHDLYGVGSVLGKRVSFLTDPEGKIAKIYDDVVPEDHAAEVLEDVMTDAA